jgi:DNA replication licensing factor MCM2
VLPVLNEVAKGLTFEINPDYDNIHQDIFVRIKDLPIHDCLRTLRQQQIDVMVNIRGVVTKRSGVFPELMKAYYRCVCGDLKGPIFYNDSSPIQQYLGKCPVCQAAGPFSVDESRT